jgi:hypothetical protein
MIDREAVRKALTGIFDVAHALEHCGHQHLAIKIDEHFEALLGSLDFTMDEVGFAE